jgi:hypothetical protein
MAGVVAGADRECSRRNPDKDIDETILIWRICGDWVQKEAGDCCLFDGG